MGFSIDWFEVVFSLSLIAHLYCFELQFLVYWFTKFAYLPKTQKSYDLSTSVSAVWNEQEL